MSVWRPAPRSLADVRDDPSRFPRDVLVGAQTGLCVFAAEWHGRQDAYWMAEAGITTTCVDLNGHKLREMSRVYPPHWAFREMDAFDYVQTSPLSYDIVSADPFTGDAMDRCHRSLAAFCKLANRAVIMGCTAAQPILRPQVPDGWKATQLLKRSDFGGGVFWAVLQPKSSR